MYRRMRVWNRAVHGLGGAFGVEYRMSFRNGRLMSVDSIVCKLLRWSSDFYVFEVLMVAAR